MGTSTDYFLEQVKQDLSTIYKSTEPELIASNDLGFLVNFFTHLRQDISFYINTLYNENNPALATKYSSLFFHAQMSGYEIELSTPATAKMILLIPKKDTTDTEYIYTFDEGQTISSDSGITFTLKYTVVVTIKNNSINAYYKSATLPKKYLSTSVIPDQIDPQLELYVINLPEVLSQSETVTTFVRVPYYEFKTSIKLKIPQRISLTELVSLHVFLLPKGSVASPEDLISQPLFSLQNHSELIELITTFDQRSNVSNLDKIVIDTTSELTMVLGDGISARKFEEGDVLIIRTEKTAGLGGNLNSFTTTFPNVPTQVTYDGYTVIENSDVFVFIPDGSRGGKTIDDVYTLRDKIVRHIFRRSSLVSEHDYKIFFENVTGHKSIVNAFSSTNSRHLIAYSALKDNTNRVIQTNTLDVGVGDFEERKVFEMFMDDNPFSDTYFSPFYVRQEEQGQFAETFIVLDKIQFGLGFQYKQDVDKHLPILYLNYDFAERKTFIDLREDNGFTYYFESDVVSGELNADNDYLLYLDVADLHDTYCFLEKEISKCRLTDLTNGTVYSVSSLSHLLPSQQLVNLYYDDGSRAIARVPFIQNEELTYYGYNYLINDLIRNFFVTDIIDDNNLFDLYLSQAFANSTKFEDVYIDLAIEYSDNPERIQTGVNLDLNIIVNMDKFVRTSFETIADFELDLKLFLSENKPNGFNMKFNESDLEKKVIEAYEFVENVRCTNLNSFKFKQESRILKDLDNAELDQKTLYNYTPQFFWVNDFNLTIKQV
jgi:hypothetical protein